MARLNDLTERRAADLRDTDEFAVQPEGDDTRPPQRSRLAWLKEFLLPSWVRNPDEDIPPEKIHQDSAGVDQTARDDAELAERTATDALNAANMAIQDVGDLIPLIQAKSDPVPTATEERTGTVTIAREQDVADSETDTSRVLNVLRGIGLIRRMLGENVRSIPEAEASHIGRPLVAVSARRPWAAFQRLGTDGYDDESVTEDKLDAAVKQKLNTGGDGSGVVVRGGAVGPSLTPLDATKWHAYETTELLNPDHLYEFIMQRGADASNQAPTVSFYGRELLEDIPASTEAAGDGYTPGNEPNHLMLIHGRSTTTGGLTLHVARLPRAQDATTDKLLIHFQSQAYRIHSLVRLPGIQGPKGDPGTGTEDDVARAAAVAAQNTANAAGRAAMAADGKAVAAQNTADAANVRANDNTREVRTARAEAATADGKAVAAQAAAEAAALTLVQKIGLLNIYIDPGVVVRQAPATAAQAITRNDYRLVIVAPDVLAGEDVWVRVFGQGQPLAARVKMNVNPAPGWATAFAITEVQATNIINNDVGGSDIDLQVSFYSADAEASLIEQRSVGLGVVQTPRVDNLQGALPNLGNGEVWVGGGRGPVAQLPPASPLAVDRTIASYDAAQNRFENSGGNPVILVVGQAYILTQAVYDAAVADNFAFPDAIFLTT